MSKSISSESYEGHESRKKSGERGAGDEFAFWVCSGGYVDDTRFATKAWKRVADAFIDERVASGTMIIHGGKDISYGAAKA
ncbi:hypothetical protein TrLO_g4402 [Triparma laevis f. longispina]|uniref:Uncharacterized protein n=1 Tax=Triparma laevis f. longispina TaxID=1714387 RepID=A0A9W6ZDF5_9STRA|nr:hypothetical protein TrLO_g4402 [Triparma laevis f. longispina]